jgi:hydroxyacylglutathione hydrolase
VVKVREGDSFLVGAIRFDVLKTPGHTPEHITFMVTDGASTSEPLGLFSGDFLFVGDVGRPDLLESAVGVAGMATASAGDLHQSIQRILTLPDHLLIWPSHGSGSACGKSLGGVPMRSLGYERRANKALGEPDRARFVEMILDGQPAPPPYFAHMKRWNQAGPPPRPLQTPPRLSMVGELLVVDTRLSEDYLAGHLRNSLHLPLGRSFLKWAGWLMPYDTDFCLLANSEEEAIDAARELGLIGLDRCAGWVGPEALQSGELVRYAQISAREMSLRADDSLVLDVRNADEWEEGHVPNAHHAPLGGLIDAAPNIPPASSLLVQCGGGVRSPIAMSVLERLGFAGLVNVEDGYSGFKRDCL